MNPQLVLALIAKFTDLEPVEAVLIAKELDLATQPSTYKDAEALVNKIVAAVKAKSHIVHL